MIEVQNVTLQIKGKTILSDANLTMEEEGSMDWLVTTAVAKRC